MAKTPKPVNRQRLVEAIATAEANGPLSNRNLLYGAAAEAYNVACGLTASKEWITASIVLLRIKEWQLTVKTPMGKRGRPAGSKIERKLGPDGLPIPRKKRIGRKASQINLDAMRSGEFKGTQYDGLIQRIAGGSLTARIKANCLSCAGFDRNEIKFCGVTSCPLWDVRPYRAAPEQSIEEENKSQLVVVDAIDTPLKQAYSQLLPILA